MGQFDVADLKIILYVAGAAAISAAAGILLLPAAALIPAGVACFGAVWLLR